MAKVTAEERFWARVQKTEGCWFWIGTIDRDGYGRFTWPGGQRAHRFVYELRVGSIPKRLTVDHLCHNRDRSCPSGRACLHRRCVNPAHLDLSTRGENARRGSPGGWTAERKAANTHCKRGHLFDCIDARNRRHTCHMCRRESYQRHIAERRQEKRNSQRAVRARMTPEELTRLRARQAAYQRASRARKRKREEQA